jgi:hypothetical protein
LFLQNADGSDGVFVANDHVQITTASAERLRVTSAGLVGIGTNTPLTKLQITATNASSPTANIFLDIDGNNTPGMGGQIIFGSSTSGTLTDYIARIQGVRSTLDNGSSDLHFQTTHVSTATGPTTKMTIKSDGKVTFSAYGSGSFTGTAAYNLQVDSSGNIIETAAGGSGTVTGSGTIGYLPKWTTSSALGDSVLQNDSSLPNDLIMPQYIRHSGDTNTYFGFYSNDNFRIITANNTVLTVTDTGRVGIGSTDPDTKLHVEGDLMLDVYNNGGSGNGIFFREGFGPGNANPYNLSITLFDDGDGSPDGLDLNAFDGTMYEIAIFNSESSALTANLNSRLANL